MTERIDADVRRQTDRRPVGERPINLCANQSVSRAHAIEQTSRRWRGGHDLCTAANNTRGRDERRAGAQHLLATLRVGNDRVPCYFCPSTGRRRHRDHR